MIERPQSLDRNFYYETDKSSPSRSNETSDSYNDTRHYFCPVPIYVFFPTPTTFFNYSLPNPISEFDLVYPDCRSAATTLQEQDVKIEMVEEINFIDKNLEQQNPRENSQQKTEYNQNEYRNVMPNLIRLILNFSLLRQKSQKYLKLVFPEISQEQIEMYYKYARRLKMNGCLSKKSYVSQKKLKDILGISDSQYFGSRSVRKRTKNQELYKQIMRTMSMYYLNNHCVETILHSSKMKKELKMVHLSRRNRLISILRRGEKQNDLNKHKL